MKSEFYLHINCFMPLFRWLSQLSTFKLEFLLPLPLVLIVFVFAGEAWTNLLLSRRYNTLDKLQANTETAKIQLASNVVVTKAKIEKELDCIKVELKTANSVLKNLRFEVPATDIRSAKIAIAQELGLSESLDNIHVGREMRVRSVVKVLGILAEIKKQKGVTTVEVNTANSVLKKLEFEFAVTDLSSVKEMINKELGLDGENARKFVSYRIDDFGS